MSSTRLFLASSRWLRLLMCALLCAVAMGGMSLATARPAAAAPTCDGDAPTPQRAGEGLAGNLDPGPAVKAAPADPFAANSTTTIYDQYGYAGLKWNTYDLGCDLGTGVKSIDPDITNWVGNSWLKGAVYQAAITNNVDRATREGGFFAPLDDVIATVSARVKQAVWTPWNAVALTALAAFLLWLTAKGELPTVITSVGWALLVLGLATAAMNYPVRASHAFDQAVIGTIGAVNTAAARTVTGGVVQTENPQAAALVDDQLYPTWLRGVLGSSTSKVAVEYGPDLFRASAMTYAETRRADASPDAAEKITKDKADLWHSTADKVKDEDPSAYAILTGKEGERSDFGGLAFCTMALTASFRLIAAALVLLALGVVRFIIVVLPAVAVPALISPFGGFMRRLMNMAGACVINVVLFSTGAMIHGVIITAILSRNDTSSWTQILVAIVTVVAFIIFWPMLNLAQIAGLNLPGVGLGIPRWAKKLAGMAVGAKLLRSSVSEGVKEGREEGTTGASTTTTLDESGPIPERRNRRPEAALELTAQSERIALPPGSPVVETEHRRGEVIDVRLVESNLEPVQPIALDGAGSPLALPAAPNRSINADHSDATEGRSADETNPASVTVDVQVAADGTATTTVDGAAADGQQSDSVRSVTSNPKSPERLAQRRPRLISAEQEELGRGVGIYVYDPRTRETVLVDEFGDVIEDGEPR